MIQSPMNKYTVLPPEQELEQEETAPRENSTPHVKSDEEEQNPLRDQQGNLVVQGERVALDIVAQPVPGVQPVEYDDRELVHEYRDWGVGYKYRRIRKEKPNADGIKDVDDEVEVEQMIFAQDLPLDEMYVWALKWNWYVGMITWPIGSIFFLYQSFGIWMSVEAEEEAPGWVWLVILLYNAFMNLIFLGANLWQRKLYRNALINKEYKEGKRQLRGLVLMPIFMVFLALMFTIGRYFSALTQQIVLQERYY